MDISNILALVNAGFTKDEIFSLIVPEQKAPEQKAPEQDAITSLSAKMDYLVNRLNYIAVQGSKQPETNQESVDDILAKMI